MEDVLKDALGTLTLKPTGKGGGGCINEGEAYLVDSGTVFVKRNKKSKLCYWDPVVSHSAGREAGKGPASGVLRAWQARLMFDGEYQSLREMARTRTVRVPKPITVVDDPAGGAALVMEYVDMRGLRESSERLGRDLAALHLHNARLGARDGGRVRPTPEQEDEDGDAPEHVGRFGFHVATCCGYLPLDNTWCDDWPTFFARHRLMHQMKLIEKDHGDREALQLWSQLQHKVPGFFAGLEITPALLHGDLWGGNVAETADGPVVFDPASFYGHHEFELSISAMFGGFSSKFYTAYHDVIPKAPGFGARQKLYQLFHYLNHWNHFGGSYRGSAISIMKALLK